MLGFIIAFGMLFILAWVLAKMSNVGEVIEYLRSAL